MTKLISVVCAAIVALGVFYGPNLAKADTDIYVNFNGPSRHARYHGRDEGWPPPHRHWRPSPAYYVAPPYYVPPARPIVYQTTVVRPQTVIVSNVGADQTSPTFTDAYGRMCREYTTSSWVGGARQNVYGTACLMPDGTWRTVN